MVYPKGNLAVAQSHFHSGLPEVNEEDKIHVNLLNEKLKSTVLNTMGVASMIPQLESRIPEDSESLVGRVTAGAPVDSGEIASVSPANAVVTAPVNVEALEDVVSQLESYKAELEECQEDPSKALSSVKKFPFPALAILMAGLEQEKISDHKLNARIAEAEKLQENTDLLLKLSAQLTNLKGDSNSVPEEMKSLLETLEARGIDILKDKSGKKLSKETISELKFLTSAEVDTLRSKLRILVATKFPALMQAVGAILEAVKECLKNHKRQVDAALRLPGR